MVVCKWERLGSLRTDGKVLVEAKGLAILDQVGRMVE